MPKRADCFNRRLLVVQTLSFCFLITVVASVRFDARAQSAGDVGANVGASAALAGRDEVLKRTAAEAAARKVAGVATAAPSSVETPPPPITEGNASKGGFEGAPITYSIDLSAMVAGGATNNGFADLPGGLDGSIIYKIDRTTRVTANYYQFSATSIGNDDDIPFGFQAPPGPSSQGLIEQVASVNGAAARFDSTTHLRFQLYNLEQMFFVGGRHHPLIIAPTYLAVRSIIGGKDDSGPIFANDQFMTVHQRSYESKSLNLAIPLFYGEKYLISYTGGAIWNMNTNGANQTNHPQYLQSGFIQYQPSQDLTLFGSISNAITYFPTEVYPYHTPTLHYGVSKYLKRSFWIEGEVSTGGPSNPNYADSGRIGIVNLTVPCSRTAAGGLPSFTCVALAGNGIAVPVVGAQRYTTFSIILGFGAAPLVRPF